MEHREGTFSGCGALKLYYQSWHPEGAEQPKALLPIVHGAGEHSGRYGNVVNWFVPRGYAVYAFDLRGHGHSPGPRGYINDWSEFREDLRLFLEFIRLQEGDRSPLFLLGHSMGGLIVLEYTLHYPQGLSGVIASGPVLARVGLSPLLMALARILSGLLPRLTLNTGLDATALSRDQAVVEAYIRDPLVHSLGTPRLGTELTRAFEWVQANAARMTVPCLIVHGSEDRLVPPEGSRLFYERMPLADKELREYNGYYHEVFNDVGKEQVLADVEAWIEKHLPRSSGNVTSS